MIFMDEGRIVEKAKTKDFLIIQNLIELNFFKPNFITNLVF